MKREDEPQCDTNNKRANQDDPQSHDLAKRHETRYEEALPGEEADGGESLLGGAPREGEADIVHKVSEPLHPGDPDYPRKD